MKIILLLLLLSGCTFASPRMEEQVCSTTLKPVVANYVVDVNASDWCKDHGAVVPSWGGCTTCIDHGSYLQCEIRLPGLPNQIDDAVLADEFQHLWGCQHKGKM